MLTVRGPITLPPTTRPSPIGLDGGRAKSTAGHDPCRLLTAKGEHRGYESAMGAGGVRRSRTRARGRDRVRVDPRLERRDPRLLRKRRLTPGHRLARADLQEERDGFGLERPRPPRPPGRARSAGRAGARWTGGARWRAWVLHAHWTAASCSQRGGRRATFLRSGRCSHRRRLRQPGGGHQRLHEQARCSRSVDRHSL
jgi:hypothetical protein